VGIDDEVCNTLISKNLLNPGSGHLASVTHRALPLPGGTITTLGKPEARRLFAEVLLMRSQANLYLLPDPVIVV
jgi:hypothetical protein